MKKSRKIIKKLLALPLAFLLLAGCGPSEAPASATGETPSSVSVPAESLSADAGGGFYYDVSFLPLDSALADAEYINADGELLCRNEKGLFWADTAGNVTLELPALTDDGSEVMFFAADADHIYVISGKALVEEIEEEDGQTGHIWHYENIRLLTLTREGAVLSETALPKLTDTNYYNSLAVTSQGVFTCCDNYIVRIADGGVSYVDFSAASSKDALSLMQLIASKSGKLLAVVQTDDAEAADMFGDAVNHICAVDFDAGVLSDPLIENPGPDWVDFYAGSAAGCDVYLMLDTDFYGYNYGDSEAAYLFSLADCSTVLSSMGAGQPVCVGEDKWLFSAYSFNNDFLAVIEKKPGVKPESTKTALTVGGLNNSLRGADIESEIILFNITHPDYELNLKIYSDEYPYNDFTGWDEAKNALNMDILNGTGPDILILGDIDWRSLAEKGVLADLYSLMSADTNFDKSDYFENILASGEQDGGLYAMPMSFSISCLAGKTELLGDRTGWTLDEFLKFGEGLPEGMALIPDGTIGANKDWYFETGYTAWIDESGCHFDDGSFAALLEYMKNDPETDMEVSALARAEGKLAVDGVTVRNTHWVGFEAMLCGGDVTYVGYPSPDRAGPAAVIRDTVGICAGSKDVPACWDFLSQLLSPTAMNGSLITFLSVERSVLEEDLRVLTLDAADERFPDSSASFGDGTELTLEPITKAQADAFLKMVESVRCVETDGNITNILNEETAAFFDGQKTAEEVAEIIQNRVSTYLAEQG